MSATAELRGLAEMFGWDSHTDDARHEDTFIHGQHMVTVDYHRDGAVGQARWYEFTSIKSPKLRECTVGRHKKEDVKHWLVQLGH